MISYLIGEIITLDFTKLTILTKSGVGYEVGINELTYSRISLEENIDLFIHHHITDNNQSLYGFLDHDTKKLFEELIKISGVGGKVAQQILAMGTARLVGAIQSEDYKTIEETKGVGKKMAEKIILELKDKDFGITTPPSVNQSTQNTIDVNLYKSIKTTLSSMGYHPRDIDEKLSNLPTEMTEASNIIPYIIKELS